MELSWFALLPTIFAVVIIAGLILTRSDGSKPSAASQEAAGEPTRGSAPFPTLTPWVDAAKTLFRDARQPVWPIDNADFTARALRGMKVAAVMVILALMAAAGNDHSDFALIGFLLAVIPFSGIGVLLSGLHSIILRLLPYRGPLVSTMLGALIGFAIMLVERDSPPNKMVIYAGAFYGLVVGVMDFLMPTQKTAHRRNGGSIARRR